MLEYGASSVPVNGECLFSIIMPTHNRAHLLARAIQSVLGQTFADFELVVIDDGSTDNTRQVVGGFGDPRIKYLHQEKTGAAVARNVGVGQSQGRIVIFLDSDDEALPEWLEHYARSFESPRVGIVCVGAVKSVERDGACTETLLLPVSYGAIFHHQRVLFLSGTYGLRRELFEAVGGYNNMASRQSVDLAIRIIPYCLQQGWAVENLQIALVKLHFHEGPGICRNVLAQYQGAKSMLQEHGAVLLAKDPKRYAMYCGVAGCNAFKLGKYGEARRFYWRALRHRPWYWKYPASLFLSLLPPLGRFFWKEEHE